MASCSSQPSVSFDFECPEKRLVQLSLIDLSSSGRAKDILDERLKTIQSDIERVTDCEGTFSLVAWSVSSASSFRVFQGTLSTSGATEIGRDRKISRAVATTMAEVRAGITEAFDYLSYIVKRKQKLNSFINALTDDDKITFKNG